MGKSNAVLARQCRGRRIARIIKEAVYSIALFISVPLFLPQDARALCEPPGTPCVEFDKAIAIFLGKVIGSHHPRTQFSVERWFKGASKGQIEIRSDLSDVGESSLRYSFKPNHSYVVYAVQFPQSQEPLALDCQRIVPLDEAGPDLAFLERRLKNEQVN